MIGMKGARGKVAEGEITEGRRVILRSWGRRIHLILGVSQEGYAIRLEEFGLKGSNFYLRVLPPMLTPALQIRSCNSLLIQNTSSRVGHSGDLGRGCVWPRRT